MKEKDKKTIIEIPPNPTLTKMLKILGQIAIQWPKLTEEQRQQILEKLKQTLFFPKNTP